MAEVMALLFLCIGVCAFTKKLKPFKVLSSLVLYFSFMVAKENVPMQIFSVSIILIALITLFYVKASKEKKDVFYFSIPCWLFIVSVLVNVLPDNGSHTTVRPEKKVEPWDQATASLFEIDPGCAGICRLNAALNPLHTRNTRMNIRVPEVCQQRFIATIGGIHCYGKATIEV